LEGQEKGWQSRRPAPVGLIEQAIATTRVARAAEFQIQFFTRRYRERRVGITAPPMLTAITVLGQSVTSGTM
jgi:hypothetical protein